jgi:hypothetical protein
MNGNYTGGIAAAGTEPVSYGPMPHAPAMPDAGFYSQMVQAGGISLKQSLVVNNTPASVYLLF